MNPALIVFLFYDKTLIYFKLPLFDITLITWYILSYISQERIVFSSFLETPQGGNYCLIIRCSFPPALFSAYFILTFKIHFIITFDQISKYTTLTYCT